MNESQKIKEFQKTCNFLDDDGDCIVVGDAGSLMKCEFEDCIFIKILRGKNE